MEANRKYKDTLFSELFSKPHHLRELYNALADTDYGEDTEIEINTLENVFFNDLKNDVSFTIDGKYVVLIEHQSTINANMPLRCLMYIARVFEKITDERAIYQEKLLKIPTPEFIVLYNGEKPFPSEKILCLSDAYIGTDESLKRLKNLELTVKVVNINQGYNDDLLRKSVTLNDYAIFVEHVRHNQRNGLVLRDAIKEAINWGVSRGLLGSLLTEHGSEVTNMLMTEFNIDIAKEVWQEEAREDAREEFQAVIAEQEVEIAEQAAEIAEQEVEIAEQEVEIAEQAAEIAEQETEIAKQAALIQELQARLGEQPAEMAD